jgi:hypothetical protein
VETLSPFLSSTIVRIEIAREAHVFEAEAKVTHCKLGMGMGLAFVSAQTEAKKLLGTWIAELGGELPRTLASGSEAAKGISSDQLSRLVSELMRVLIQKGLLTEVERKEMLMKIQS